MMQITRRPGASHEPVPTGSAGILAGGVCLGAILVPAEMPALPGLMGMMHGRGVVGVSDVGPSEHDVAGGKVFRADVFVDHRKRRFGCSLGLNRESCW
jgi:hypothetical protein